MKKHFNNNNIAMALGITMASGVVFADEANKPLDTQKAEDSIALEEVIVTAQKREQNLQETPIAITAFDQQAIASQGVHDISDISTSTPNVQIAPSPGGSTGATVAIRGASMINPAVTWEPAVGIYMDGVFVAKNMGGLFDVAELERIEVLRGPQGTLYGKNTTGGAINLISRKPDEEFGGSAKVGLGNFGYTEAAASIDTGKVGEVAKFNIAVNKRDRDGFYENTSTAPDAADEFKKLDSMAARLAGLFDVADNVELYYTFDMSKKDNTPAFGQLETPSFATGKPVLPDPERADKGAVDGAEYEKSESSGHAFHVTWDVTDNMAFKSITAYREMKFDDANDYDGFDDADGNGINGATIIIPGTFGFGVNGTTFHTERHIEQSQTSQEFQLLGEAGIVNYVTGLFYLTDKADTVNPFTAFFDSDYVAPTATTPATDGPIPGSIVNVPHFYGVDGTSSAIFGQADIAATDLLTVTVGARYTTESKDAYLQAPFAVINVEPSETWTNFSPMMALNFAINDDVNTYAKVSKGWKAGGFNAEAGTTPEATKPYDEETLTAYEIGMKSRWVDNRIQGNVAVFQNNVDDLQVSAWNGSASEVANAGEARVSGVEMEGIFIAAEGLEAFFNYGYLDTKYLDFINPVDGAQLKDSAKFGYSPRSKYTLGFNYSVNVNFAELNTRVDYSYTDEQYFYYDAFSAAVTKSADYALVNARIALSEIAASKETSLEVGLWGKNLTDEDYRLNGIPTASAQAVNYYGDPRTVGIDAIYNF